MAIHHKKDDKIFYRNRCLICQKFLDQKRYNKEKRKEYYKKNKELNNEYSRNWSLNNKERKLTDSEHYKQLTPAVISL